MKIEFESLDWLCASPLAVTVGANSRGLRCAIRAISSAGECFLDVEEVVGSNPILPIEKARDKSVLS
jgi:hypothetical protein